MEKDGRRVRDAKLVVDEGEAQLVRLIFDLYQNISQRRVVLYLNERGYRLPVKSPKNQRAVGQTLRVSRSNDKNRIINTKLYAGLLTWCENPKSRITKGNAPTRHYIPELQIVSLEKFNLWQHLRFGNLLSGWSRPLNRRDPPPPEVVESV